MKIIMSVILAATSIMAMINIDNNYAVPRIDLNDDDNYKIKVKDNQNYKEKRIILMVTTTEHSAVKMAIDFATEGKKNGVNTVILLAGDAIRYASSLDEGNIMKENRKDDAHKMMEEYIKYNGIVYIYETGLDKFGIRSENYIKEAKKLSASELLIEVMKEKTKLMTY